MKDPQSLFQIKQQKNEFHWNEREKEIFLEKLLMYGKNFTAIASYLEKKVNFEYLSTHIYYGLEFISILVSNVM